MGFVRGVVKEGGKERGLSRVDARGVPGPAGCAEEGEGRGEKEEVNGSNEDPREPGTSELLEHSTFLVPGTPRWYRLSQRNRSTGGE